MTVWFVSRHPGALEWMQRHGPAFDRHVEHLAPDDVQPGDRVVGTLPMQLAAQVCARGAEYWHLVLHMPQPVRAGAVGAAAQPPGRDAAALSCAAGGRRGVG